MHTSKDDYLINTLRFFSTKESTKIYGKLLPKTLTSPEMKESKAYKTYLGYASGVVPPKIAKKFKKASPSKKDSSLVPVDDEPAKKETRSKRKEKVDVAHGKGIDLLSEVALTEEAQMKEVRNKSLRDFYKTHPSGSGTVTEKPPRFDKITPTVIKSWGNDEANSNDDNDLENEGNDEENKSDADKTPSDSKKGSDSEQDTDGSESDSESDQHEYKEEVKDDEEEDEIVHTPSNSDDEEDANLESKNDDKSEGDEDRGMDDMTNQFSDDVQDKEADVEITDAQQEKGSLEITQEQVVEDAHVKISNVAKETEVPNASFSYSSDLASKFLNFLDIHPNDAEIVSPLDVHVHHEVLRTHTSSLLIVPVSVIPEASPDPLHTQVTALVDDHQDTRMGATRKEFMNFLSASLTDRITKQVRNQLPQILPEEVSNFAPHVIKNMIEESLNLVNLEKVSSQPQSTYEAAATLTEFELKKILIDKMNTSESYLIAPEHRECYDGLIKSYHLDKDFFSSYDAYSFKQSQKDKDKDEGPTAGSDRGFKKRKTSKDTEPTIEVPEFEVADIDMPHDQGGDMGNDDDEPRKKKLDWENPEGGDYPFDLTKPLLLVKNRLTNLSGDDVADFSIALKMFTRSLVIKKRVRDLQLGVKSYQNKINVTKPDTVPAKEKMEFLGKEKSSPHDQGNQQVAEGNKDDAELGKICCEDGNPTLANIKQALGSMSMLVQKSQDHKMGRLQDDAKRLCLVDDLKKLKITFMSSQR
uniref:Uncharacterized protein n=1 Tax=Tanacetum cinerariifolium TaxID=118510 RepID=A0A6L2P1E0_TANCI|nr:hypothetical protein [Tanacetum cinerariifolium]